MKVEIKTYWSDLDQAIDFAETVSRQYPGLKVYLSAVEERSSSVRSYSKKVPDEQVGEEFYGALGDDSD